MGADDDVQAARLQVFECLFLLPGVAEARQELDAHRECNEALLEGVVMLERQNRGGSKHSHLLGIHDGLESRPHGHLCLSVSHVSAEEAVHGAGIFHIALDRLDGVDLVPCQFKLESIFELLLPGRVLAERKTLHPLALGV